MNELFLTPEELAARWKLKRKTLQDWRRIGKGPKFVQLEGKHGNVRYHLEDVQSYEQAHRIDPDDTEDADTEGGQQ